MGQGREAVRGETAPTPPVLANGYLGSEGLSTPRNKALWCKTTNGQVGKALPDPAGWPCFSWLSSFM